MVTLIVVRKANPLLEARGIGVPRHAIALMALSIWWIYWGSVVFFGIIVIRRWQNSYFRWRTLSTMVSQTLFGVFLMGPLKTYLEVPYFWQRLHLTWPLHMSAITPYLQTNFPAAFAYGIIISLIAWPLITVCLGMRYCSWFCFCGNLAENMGDSFRRKGPKGSSAQALDNTGYWVLGIAAIATVALWAKLEWPYDWYDFIVGFMLADVVGISFYLILGNRVWCRFFCPLRAMLGWFSRQGRFAIFTDGQRCIECGTCNRYCEMGIDIRERARQGIPMRDTECVACGACVAVCPRYALSFYAFPEPREAVNAHSVRRFRSAFRRQLATPLER
jgi:polyferredoxin